jgi:hypothetical protein
LLVKNKIVEKEKPGISVPGFLCYIDL